jgi:endonuclease-3
VQPILADREYEGVGAVRHERRRHGAGDEIMVNRAAGEKFAARPKKAVKRPVKKPPARLTEAQITEIFRRFAEASPEPKSELEYKSPYTLLVAVVLSAQATDAGVNKATRILFKHADTPQKMVRLGEDRLRDFIKTIGLYRNKARNVILLSQQLIELHGGSVPRDREALEALPGVGRKTANVVLNVAFGEPTMAVDTHVFRVANRIGLSRGKTPLAVEEDLLRVVPPQYATHAHHWLILHGRYVCKARVPECPRCIINDLCLYDAKTTLGPGGVPVRPAIKSSK